MLKLKPEQWFYDFFFVFFYQEKGELSKKNQEKTNNRHIYKQSMLSVSKKLDYQFDFFS